MTNSFIPRNQAEADLARLTGTAQHKLMEQIVDAGWRPPHTQDYLDRKYDLLEKLSVALNAPFSLPVKTPEVAALFEALGVDTRSVSSVELHVILVRILG